MEEMLAVVSTRAPAMFLAACFIAHVAVLPANIPCV